MSIAQQRLVSASIAFACLFLAVEHEVRAQKPVREDEIVADGPGAPASAEEMVKAADAVVVARYTGRSRLIPAGSPGGLTALNMTSYTLKITEIVKGLLPVTMNEELVITMLGGDQEFSDHILRTRVAGTEPLRSGREYVVFLRFDTVRNNFQLAWAAAGLYDVTAATVRGLERGGRRRYRDGETVTVFLEHLRAAAAQ